MTEAKSEKPVLGPSSNVLEALKEGQLTEPKTLHKPNGQEIATRLVVEGAGMVGLEDRRENQEWAGIFNHYVKTAGASLYLGRLLQLNGQEVDLQLMLDTVTISHSGRRQYDEATWYPAEVNALHPEETAHSDAIRKAGDTKIGLANLQDKNLSPRLLEMISVHGLGDIFPFEATTTWNHKLPLYLDFRISQNAMSLEQRFVDMQRGVAAGRVTQEFLDRTHDWATAREHELFEALNLPSYEAATQSPANLKARIDTAIKLGKFSEAKAKVLLETDLYKPKSGRKGDIAQAIGLSHEDFLAKLQLHSADINDRLLQPERWEQYIRRLYINDAEAEIFDRLSQLHQDISEGKVGNQEELDKEFPQNTWWGKYARELYEKRHSVPLTHKQLGIARAIEFYRSLEQTRLDTKE